MNLGITELKIEALSNEETATVEILGNENLNDGDNTVTIIVSSQDNENKVTYQIKVNRKEKVVETPVKDNKAGYIDSKVFLYIAIGSATLIALILVVAYAIKHKDSNEFDENDEEDEYENEDEKYNYFSEKLTETEEETNNKDRKKGKHF